MMNYRHKLPVNAYLHCVYHQVPGDKSRRLVTCLGQNDAHGKVHAGTCTYYRQRATQRYETMGITAGLE